MTVCLERKRLGGCGGSFDLMAHEVWFVLYNCQFEIVLYIINALFEWIFRIFVYLHDFSNI